MDWALEVLQWSFLVVVILVAIVCFDVLLGAETSLLGLVLHAYDSSKPVVTGVEGMVGRTATVVKEFEESEGWLVGTVTLRGELWKARTPLNSQTLAPGSQVTVEAVRGLVLDVAGISNSSVQPTASGRG